MSELFKEIHSFADLSSGLKSSLIVTTFLAIASLIIGLRVKRLKASDVPGGVTLVAIMLVEMVNNSVKDIYKKSWKTYAPLLMTILLFLLFANTVGLFGLTAPLTSIMVALSFSLFAFLCIQIVSFAVVDKPWKRALGMLNPMNLVGEISTPLTMGLRLFGNLLSGSILGILIFRGSYELASAVFSWIPITILDGTAFAIVQVLGVGIGAFIHAIFNIFFGVVQAYVYFTLFSIFMSMSFED